MKRMKGRVLVVAAQWNDMVVKKLVDGAVGSFTARGFESSQMKVVWVPGSFELPVAAAVAARSQKYDAIVALGCVIRGETAHFDFVAGQAAEGLMRVGLESGMPVIFGVLTTEDTEQALARAGGKLGNKGSEAAEAALQMLESLADIKEG